MKLFFRLFGVQLNQRLGISAIRAGLRDDPKRTLGRSALWLIVLISFGALIGMYTWLVYQMLPAFQQLGMESLLLGLIFLLSMAFVFFMGIVYLIGTLFFSKDTEFLASLPIPQRTVFAAKFGQVLLGEIGVSMLLLLPPCIVYGIMSGVGIGYWLCMVLILPLVPCIPLALSALLSLLLMRFTALWRRRDLLTVIGSVALVVAIMLGQWQLQSLIPEDMGLEAVMALITDSSGLLQRITAAFPPSRWAAEGLLHGGGSLLLFLAVSVAALALVIVIAGRIYYGGAMAQLESSSSQRQVSLTGRSVRRHSTLFALFLREWRTVARSPVYALNGLIVIIMGPLLMLLPKFMQNSVDAADMGALFAFLQGAVDQRLILLVLSAIFVAIGMISPATFTSISREGKCFYLLRTMPVSPVRQITAKYLFGLSIAVIAMVFMGATATLAFSFPVGIVLGAFGFGLWASLCPVAIAMIPDVLKPKLSWNSETEAIKQNINGILGMLIGWGYLFLLCFLGYKLLQRGMSTVNLLWLMMAGTGILGLASFWVLGLAARRSWRRIEG